MTIRLAAAADPPHEEAKSRADPPRMQEPTSHHRSILAVSRGKGRIREGWIAVMGICVSIQDAPRFRRMCGPIIDIGSVGSDQTPVADHAIFFTTKLAVASLPPGPARDLGPRGITVSDVQPGRLSGDVLFETLGDMADQVRNAIAPKRCDIVEDVAAMVTFLAGERASFVAGASFRVDRGTTA